MSTIQCQAFTKQASHQTHLQSQKCFHICSTLRRKNTNHCESSFHSLSQLPVGSSNMVHQLERRRGGPPSAPSSTCRPPTNPQHQHQHRQQQHQHCWQFKLGPPTEGPPYTISSTCRPPMITRLPAGLAQQLPALVQRTTCLRFFNPKYSVATKSHSPMVLWTSQFQETCECCLQ